MKSLLLLIFTALSLNTFAQTKNFTQPFGKIDIADLQMKECEFEKDANAMVLFDKGDVYFDEQFNVVMERHVRIKIFNAKGMDETKIRLEYISGNRAENITGIQAETINEVNGKAEITKLDHKLLYNEATDKYNNAYVFTFPNVKPGSIIEYKYRFQNTATYALPDWEFQGRIPVLYSEIDTETPDELVYRTQARVHQPYFKNTTEANSKSFGSGANATTVTTEKHCRALVNIPSLSNEAYMSSRVDNQQSIFFQLTAIRPVGGFVRSLDTWAKVGGVLIDDEDFGGQLKRKLKGEEIIIEKAKTLKSNDEKIAFIFNEVKNRMKWNESDRYYTTDGTVKAWEKQSGNSTEINLALFHLLKQSGIEVYPMVVSTREHGKVNYAYPFLYQFNRAVAYIPVDSNKHYVLDATGKYNLYNETPYELLNSNGLYIDKDKKRYDLVFLKKDEPVRRVVVVNAEIAPEGKMTGTAEVNCPSYFKVADAEKFKKDGEEKFKEYLKNGDNNLSISALKMENLDVDTLPLGQKIDFKLSLSGSDAGYIYFSPNLFSSLQDNPFLNEKRATDIDFGFIHNYSINGNFKLPAGFKIDALPKNVTLVMPDQSINFKRVIGEQDGSIVIRYIISFKKVVYFKENYPELHEFYKKMNEMLNEQIVLKKS